MGRDLRKLDLIALTSSKNAADVLFDVLTGLREDQALALAGDTSIFHKAVTSFENTIDATDLPEVITLANSLKAKVNVHLASTGIEGAHLVASAEAIAAADATDQTTVNTLLNEIKADFNTHLTESGIHINDDGTNTVTAAAATNLATSLTLANEIKADHNAHIAVTMASPVIKQSN